VGGVGDALVGEVAADAEAHAADVDEGAGDLYAGAIADGREVGRRGAERDGEAGVGGDGAPVGRGRRRLRRLISRAGRYGGGPARAARRTKSGPKRKRDARSDTIIVVLVCAAMSEQSERSTIDIWRAARRAVLAMA